MSTNFNDPYPPHGAPQPFGQGGKSFGAPTDDDRMWALFAHLSPLLLGFIGPLVIWLVKKDQSAFVEDQAKESLNFQLAVMIVALICMATCVGAILIPVVGIGALVYEIIGGLEANKGVLYRYPYTFRLIN